MISNVDYINKLLAGSKFRSRFHLSAKDKEYIKDKGMDVIKQHTLDFINKNLKDRPVNDGKQTPFKGHPTFIAQHATATCCRSCIEKWYKIQKDVQLSVNEINFISDRIIQFIENELGS